MAARWAVVYLLWSAGQATGAVLVQYEFSQDDCRRGIVEDVAGRHRYFGNMILDNSTTSCLSGIGMERTLESPGSPGASSVGNTTFLREDLYRDASSLGRFSLELWLSIDRMPVCDKDCTTPVVTIGERGVSIDDDCQENMGMMITYWTGTGTGDGEFGARFQSLRDSCERFWSGVEQPTETVGNALHLVFTVDRTEYFGDPYAYFEWFINGTRVAWDLSPYVPPETMMTSWGSDFNLQVLDSSRQIPSSFYQAGPGIKIFFLAIHDETLDSTEVFSRYSARVRSSTPTVRDTIVYVAEDGENGDHYGEPESYLQVFPQSELQLIPLDVYDSDNDPATPNYDNSSPRVFVSKLPFPGSLVSSSDEDIVSVPFEVFGEDGVFTVKYRPILNDFSTNDSVPYANFSFYAIDEEEVTRSQTNATVSIYVYPKNDPPEAFTASHEVNAGTRNNIVPLHGTDMDPLDDVHGAAIVESPARGSLFQVFENGSASNVAVTAGELLWRQSVAYEHNISLLSSNSPTEQTVGSDAFSFRVFDLHSNYSVPAVINITVVTGVLALGQEGLCSEEIDCDVRLYGSAIDDNDGNLSITVTGVSTYGSFFDAVTNGIVEVGSMLSKNITYPYDNGASVVYRPPKDFFTFPATEWNGTQLSPRSGPVLISFYVSLALGSAKLSSTEVTQELKVVNVNDNSTIACEEAILQIQGSGVVREDVTFDYARPDHLFIDNFFITEEDRGVDPIRVSIDVELGYLTLNDTLVSRVSFEFLCSGTVDWRCTGDGIRFRSMVFVGAPKDVQNVLNGMLFVSYEANVMDNMTVTIFDGFEGECIWEFSTFSQRPSCFSSRCSVQINVTETWLGDDDDDRDALLVLTLNEFFALFALTTALLTLLARYCLRSCSVALCYLFGLRKRGKVQVHQVGQKRRGIVVDEFTTMAFNSSRRTPARIPAGRTGTKGAVEVCSDKAEKYSFWGLDVLRRYNCFVNRGSSVAAAQNMPRGHFESPGELTWEEND